MWCVNVNSMHSTFGHLEFENNFEKKIYSFLYFPTGIKTTLIYPATQEQIAKYSDQELYIVKESAEIYKKVTLPYIKKMATRVQVKYILLFCIWFKV